MKECDAATGMDADSGEDLATTAITQGFDNRMVPQVVPATEQNAKYNLYIQGLERWYYVHVEAPKGYLFTAGICNDEEEGWECKYSNQLDVQEAAAPTRRLLDLEAEDLPETSFGIQSGRSTSCVYIDKTGTVDQLINFGVMKVGDTREAVANVALVLGFDNAVAALDPNRRRLADIIRRAVAVDEVDDGVTVTTRYLLGDRDKAAIGTVTAEVLAVTLDSRLAENGVTLDAVDPKEVLLSSSRPSDGASSTVAGNQLAVALEIKGHYAPPPELDFDYIVQDSINRDTATIRRGLSEYNSNCRDQKAKTDEMGLQKKDFNAVASSKGSDATSVALVDGVFSTACSSGFLTPEYFETDLKDIQARKVSEVEVNGVGGEVVYIAEGGGSGLEPWAMGPVAGIAGLIVLLIGALVFRRALGPRRVDVYSDKRKTKLIDGDEMRCFGEAGGAMDDGSVDSAFYSDDDGSDLEETEKERRMRRKRKEKGYEQRKSGKPSSSVAKEGRKRGGGLPGDKGPRSRKNEQLAVSQGSDDTESLDKWSKDSSEEDADAKKKRSDRRRKKKRSAEDRSEKKSSSTGRRDRDTSDRERARRGRNKRSGGDNANAHEEAEIV